MAVAKIVLAKTNRVPGANGNGKSARPPIVDAFTDRKGVTHPLLVLNPDGNWPFKFGVGKAKTILANLEYVKQFVAEYGSHEEQE